MFCTTLLLLQAERCNFDSSAICGFTQASNDQFDWSRTSRKSWGSNTGPSFDHTTGNGTGMCVCMSRYIYFFMKTLSPTLCVEFYITYIHMKKKYFCNFK